MVTNVIQVKPACKNNLSSNTIQIKVPGKSSKTVKIKVSGKR